MVKMPENNTPKLRILVADDLEYMRKLIAQFLSKDSGVSIIGEASDGDEALRLAHEHKPDIILLDMNMPNTNGVEVAKKIRTSLPDIRIYFISAYDVEDFKNLINNSPANGFIQKASLKVELQQMVQTELDRK